MRIVSATTQALRPTAIALGNFDGLHRGHQRVVAPIIEIAAQNPSVRATVVTFDPHPQEFLTGQTRKLLTPLTEKGKILEQLGVEQLVCLPFERELAALTPEAFVEQILRQGLEAQWICVGEDFHFGRDRQGSAHLLKELAHPSQVLLIPLETIESQRISSSQIRQALLAGELEKAHHYLGRPYTLRGTVVPGQQLGRTLGFPTANLHLPPNKFLPRHGVYSVVVKGENLHRKGVMNLGCRPTVNPDQIPTLEVHLLDWCGDLYGQTLTVQLEQFIRPEQKFSSLEALKAQIKCDCQVARAI